MNLQALARALDGDITSGHVLAPGPGHSKHDRSMAVYLDPHVPDLIRVHSFAGDRWQDCLVYAKARLGIADNDRTWTPPQRIKSSASSQTDTDRTRYARSIWNEAKP